MVVYTLSCFVEILKWRLQINCLYTLYPMVAGATVHMVCRNPERGEQAKQDIISESGNDVSKLKASIFTYKLHVVHMNTCM